MQAQDTAREYLQGLDLTQLIELFESTESQIQKASEDEALTLSTARGWLLEELEDRDPVAFKAWLETEECSVGDLRRLFAGGES